VNISQRFQLLSAVTLVVIVMLTSIATAQVRRMEARQATIHTAADLRVKVSNLQLMLTWETAPERMERFKLSVMFAKIDDLAAFVNASTDSAALDFVRASRAAML